MQKWEYLSVVPKAHNNQLLPWQINGKILANWEIHVPIYDYINKLGEQGWEFVVMNQYVAGSEYHFKRKMTERWEMADVYRNHIVFHSPEGGAESFQREDDSVSMGKPESYWRSVVTCGLLNKGWEPYSTYDQDGLQVSSFRRKTNV